MIGLLFWLFVAFILYTYAGYPLLIAILARLRPRPPRVDARLLPPVTLLIAAYNEEKVIARRIENALALDYPRESVQILVAADGSDDRTPEIVGTYAGRGVELSYEPQRRGKMAAINRAILRARGEIVVFSDANNLYRPDALRELVAPFQRPRVGVVSGAKHVAKDEDALSASEGLYWKYESFIKKCEARLGCCVAVAGEILAVRRDLFQAPPEAVICDDFFTAMMIVRQGYNVDYAQEAVSVERVSASAQDEVARRGRIIAGRYQAIALARRLLTWRRPAVAWQVVSHKFFRPFVPHALIGIFLVSLLAVIFPRESDGAGILALAFPYNWVFFAPQVLFYVWAVIGMRFERRGSAWKLLYLPSYLVNSNLAAVIGGCRFLAGKHSVLWPKVARKED
ncbi:MAG TPA: glycosyltransferase family 2 protein [Sumerlaeia bacterium]|nr:glycosyltransferase family 2 protein [Sumerlaeia bacterium]